MSSFVTCPGCSKKITLTDKLRGRKVKCGCGKILKMPGDPVQASPNPTPVQPTPPPNPAASQVVQPVPVNPVHVTPIPITPVNPVPIQPVASAAPIPVTCASCFAQFNVNASMAGKAAQCNCGSVINIPTPSAQPPALPVESPVESTVDPFGMQPTDPLGFSAANPLGVAASQPAPASNPYWAQGGSQSGKPKKRKVKKKQAVQSPDDEWDAGSMGAIGGIFGGVILGGVGVVLTLASMDDEGYTIYYGLMVTGAFIALGGIARLVTGD